MRLCPVEHGRVAVCEAVGDIRQPVQRLGNGAGTLLEQPDLPQGVVAAGADHEMARVRRQALELTLDAVDHRTVLGQQGRPPALRQDVPELGRHVGSARHIGAVVEHRITEQDNVLHHHLRGGTTRFGRRHAREGGHRQHRATRR